MAFIRNVWESVMDVNNGNVVYLAPAVTKLHVNVYVDCIRNFSNKTDSTTALTYYYINLINHYIILNRVS